MCYKQFVTYTCGCGTVALDLPCDFVTHAFTIRERCPEYFSESSQSNNACSRGFYCTKSTDANYLDDLHQQRYDNTVHFLNMSNEGQARQQQFKVTLAGALAANVSREDLKSHPTFKRLRSCIIDLNEEIKTTKAKILGFEHAINEVKEFYSRYGGPHSAEPNWSKAPSFVETVGPRRFTNTVITATSLDVSNSTPNGQLPEGNKVVVAPYRGGQTSQQYGNPKTGSARETNDVKVTQPRGRSRRVIKQDSTLKRGRESESPAKAGAQQEKVRRSARVVNKKINYMESDETSPSRAVSPGESDVSGFAPSNSDISNSPDNSNGKRGRASLRTHGSGLTETSSARNNNSLIDKLSDFQGFLRRRSPLRDGPVNYEVPSLQTKIVEGTSDSKPHLPAPSVSNSNPTALVYGDPYTNFNSSSRPPTRHGIPNQSQFINRGNIVSAPQPPAMPTYLPSQPVQLLQPVLQNGSQSQTTYSPVYMNPNDHQATGNWLMNTPTYQSTVSTNGNQAYSTMCPPNQPQQRVDSLTSQTTPINFATEVEMFSTKPEYERMSRSFSVAADLTPPATTPAPTSTDPKKRKLPASSPLQSNNKRLNFPLPGNERLNKAVNGPPSMYRQILPRSSPSKMPSQSTSFDSNPGQQQSREQDEGPPIPAPIFAPTAIMYDPTQYEPLVETGPEIQGASVLDTFGGGEGEEGDVDDAFSDASWNEPDFDPLSEFLV